MAREHTKWISRIAAATAILTLLSPMLATRAVAQERGRGPEYHHDGDGRWWRHGDIRRFRDTDLRLWRGGRWVHSRHGGQLGWWWVVGGAWYFYPAPVYPYPNPYVPPVIVTPAPPLAQAPAQYWYYCDSARGYYPYVTSCPEGWRPVAPQP